MITVTEDRIGMLAPNASAAANGKKISSKGGFVSLNKDKDETAIWGECTGSGKSNYKTSADFINPDQPVFRCSCPSRQFPCKHAIGLLYDYLAGKKFEAAELEESLAEKRAKAQDRAEKKETKAKEGAEKPKVNKAALTKKMKKQLEGLAQTAQIVEDILTKGISSMAGNSLKPYEDLAKQMGDYYLPGPQILLRRLILDMKAIKDQADDEKYLYEDAVGILEKLSYLSTRAAAFLNQKLENDNVQAEDSAFYENIGYIWKLDGLRELGLYKENARLIQLAFYVDYDEARAEYVDTGYVADIDTGEIFCTKNYRPVKALKYVKEDDTVFELIEVPVLYYYPGDANRRVRFEEFTTRPVTAEDLALLRTKAGGDLAAAVKAAKNTLKNVLSGGDLAAFIRFRTIASEKTASGERQWYLTDAAGVRIALTDGPGNSHAADSGRSAGFYHTTNMLTFLTDGEAIHDQVLLGAFYYDAVRSTIGLIPYSILTEEQIFRLAF